MTTPAEIRRRRDIRRSVGKVLIAVGLVAIGVAIVAGLIDTSVIGVGNTMFAYCGAALDPSSQVGEGAAACGQALSEQLLFALVVGGLGALAVVAGVIVMVRNAP